MNDLTPCCPYCNINLELNEHYDCYDDGDTTIDLSVKDTKRMTVYLLWEHDGNETNLFGVYRLKAKAVAWEEYFEKRAKDDNLYWLNYSVTEAQVRE